MLKIIFGMKRKICNEWFKRYKIMYIKMFKKLSNRRKNLKINKSKEARNILNRVNLQFS